jgi:hypothetical protein
VGDCADWSLMKLGPAILALLVSGVIMTIAR